MLRACLCVAPQVFTTKRRPQKVDKVRPLELTVLAIAVTRKSSFTHSRVFFGSANRRLPMPADAGRRQPTRADEGRRVTARRGVIGASAT